MKNEIVLYRQNELEEHIEVKLNDDTVWLTIEQMASLFGRDRTVINRHINTIFKESELQKEVACAFFAHTTLHGAIKGKTQTSEVQYFNLDVIISVGYRVKSKQGTQFRIWANKVLKDYLLKGYAVNNRINRIEDRMDNFQSKLNEIDLKINSHLIPTQGIFYDSQVFDAYELTTKIIKSAKKTIFLIDNYIDESVITHLSKKNTNVKVIILTKNINKQLELDIKKANEQYGDFEIRKFDKSHDRFIIIDNSEVFHLGASLKDLGKKWFAFSKLEPQNLSSLFVQINEVLN